MFVKTKVHLFPVSPQALNKSKKAQVTFASLSVVVVTLGRSCTLARAHSFSFLFSVCVLLWRSFHWGSMTLRGVWTLSACWALFCMTAGSGRAAERERDASGETPQPGRWLPATEQHADDGAVQGGSVGLQPLCQLNPHAPQRCCSALPALHADRAAREGEPRSKARRRSFYIQPTT